MTEQGNVDCKTKTRFKNSSIIDIELLKRVLIHKKSKMLTYNKYSTIWLTRREYSSLISLLNLLYDIKKENKIKGLQNRGVCLSFLLQKMDIRQETLQRLVYKICPSFIDIRCARTRSHIIKLIKINKHGIEVLVETMKKENKDFKLIEQVVEDKKEEQIEKNDFEEDIIDDDIEEEEAN